MDAASYREALSSILEETSRLNETVDSLLLLARTEANLGSEDAEVFAICEPVYEIINLLGVLLEDRQIVIQTLGEEKSRTKVKAKRGLLRVALMNVLHNALKFSPDASVLRISYDRPTAPDHRIRLTIEDEGPGIATANTSGSLNASSADTSSPTKERPGPAWALPSRGSSSNGVAAQFVLMRRDQWCSLHHRPFRLPELWSH